MRTRNVPQVLAGIVVALVGACASGPPPGLVGAYRFDDGRIVSIRRSVDETLRYRVYQTGESRRLYRDDGYRYVSGPGFATKEPVELRVEFEMGGGDSATSVVFHHRGSPRIRATRINREEWITFASDGTELFGRIDFPDAAGPYPAIVLVHGSGSDAATEYFYTCDFFAAHGIAALTFDKRGTGKSGGDYTFDFHQLAADVNAAVDYLRTRPDIDTSRIGLAGYSQGGWVAPLAASMSSDVRYVLASYGLVGSPAEEARVETRHALSKRGVEGESLDQLDELTNAAVAVVASNFDKGWKEFYAVKNKYKDAPWRKQLSGTVVGQFVKYPRFLIKFLGRRRAPKGLDWYYDSMPVLESLSIPMVWFVGEKDESAPPELAIPQLEQLIAEERPVDMTVYPGADHVMLVFEERDGERTYTGYYPGYWVDEVEAALDLCSLTSGR